MNRFLFLLITTWISGNHFFHSTSVASVIDVSPKTTEVKEREKVIINCSQSANPTNTTSLNFTWAKSGEDSVLSFSSQLTLLNIRRADSGNYVCTATNGTANWSAVAVATITVLYPPKIVDWTGNLKVNESSETNFFCKASGYPPPTIRWSLPNGSYVVPSNSESLKFANTLRKQHGRYSCQAFNKVGNSPPKVMYLNVQYKPKINNTGREKKVDSWLHHNSTLTCEADGNPFPEITWSKEIKGLLSKSGSIFVIPKNDTDFGVYICKAFNVVGKDEFHVNVERTAFPPDAPTILNTERQLSSRSLILNWTRPNDRARPIFRYWVSVRTLYSNSSKGAWKETDAGKNLYYNITLEWASSFEFSVQAENDQGRGAKSNKTIVTVLPEPTTPGTQPTKTSPSAKPTDSTLLYAGIAAGCGLFLVIVVVVTLCCLKRRCRRRSAQPMQPLVDLKELQSHLSTKNSPRPPNKNTYNAVPRARVPTRNESRSTQQVTPTSHNLAIYTNMTCMDEEKPDWEFPREKVHIEKYVGKGAFCVVAKAHAEGLGIVAVKIPKEKAPDSNKKDLLAEYELMKQLRHPNVIRLMGAVTRSDPVMVMFEYIPYGDLLGFLRRSRGLDDKYYKDPDIRPSSSLTSEQLLTFAREIADGMAYLAANKIIHRDLAARNVLVGEEETCKITDFGMARDVQLNDIYQKRTKGRLPVKWTAVESLLYGTCTTQSDVWSYGVVLYEIFTIGGKPYPNIQAHSIAYMLKDNYRMPKPAHLDDDIYALMCECWHTDPNLRPTFDAISATIKRLERCHKEIIYMNVYDEDLYGNVDDWD